MIKLLSEKNIIQQVPCLASVVDEQLLLECYNFKLFKQALGILVFVSLPSDSVSEKRIRMIAKYIPMRNSRMIPSYIIQKSWSFLQV